MHIFEELFFTIKLISSYERSGFIGTTIAPILKAAKYVIIN